MRKSRLSDPSLRFDSERGVYRGSFDPDSEPVSDAVVWTLAEITGQEVDALEPIESVVDPIVFDAFVRRRRAPIQVSFVYNGHTVTVESRGEVIVQPVQSDGGETTRDSVAERTDSTGQAGAFHTTHDWGRDATLTYTIVEAVAAVKDVTPTDLEPLQTAVDTDALEQLVSSVGRSASQDWTGHVEFTFEGCQVVVTSSGDVTVRPPSTDGARTVVSTEQEFEVALTRLIREAEGAGVDVDGGWLCRGGAPSRTRGVEIYEVDDSGRR